MITVILENGKNDVIKKISSPDNREYFLKSLNPKTYPILSELSDSDNEMVSSEQMPQLIQELELLKNNVEGENARHINEVIDMAKLAETNKEYLLIFTPFGSFWER